MYLYVLKDALGGNGQLKQRWIWNAVVKTHEVLVNLTFLCPWCTNLCVWPRWLRTTVDFDDCGFVSSQVNCNRLFTVKQRRFLPCCRFSVLCYPPPCLVLCWGAELNELVGGGCQSNTRWVQEPAHRKEQWGKWLRGLSGMSSFL